MEIKSHYTYNINRINKTFDFEVVVGVRTEEGIIYKTSQFHIENSFMMTLEQIFRIMENTEKKCVERMKKKYE